MSGNQSNSSNGAGQKSRLLLFLAVLFVSLAVMFHRSFEPNMILFANDGPLGMMESENSQYPQTYFGHWIDTWWVGMETPSSSPNITGILGTLLAPQLFMKIFAPLSLAFVGLGVWTLFRQLRFGPMVCLIGGLAAAMDMNYFSVTCWGLGTWALAVGSTFFALAAMSSTVIRFAWARAVLAGLAVGMCVMEGFDVGAILSVFAGLYAIFVAWNQEGSPAQKVARVIWQPALVVIFAVFIATHTIATLISTQIQGIVGTGQDKSTREAAWPRATAGSVPRLELLRVIIPGVMGYRMDSYIHEADKSSSYWGRISEVSPNLNMPDGKKTSKTFLELLDSDDTADRTVVGKAIGLGEREMQALTGPSVEDRFHVVHDIKAQIPMGLRHSGSGKYVGIFVTVLALFALGNSFRRGGGLFTPGERRCVWFWGIVALLAVLLALGRHGFLYWAVFNLPCMSSIRNPEKFLMVFNLAWIILSGYALEILRRGCLDVSFRPASLTGNSSPFGDFLKVWKWVSISLVGAAVLIPLILMPDRHEMELRLMGKMFSKEEVGGMVSFLYGELAWFLVFLSASLGLVWLILNGTFSGKRASWAWVLGGVLMFADLAHADAPWPEYYDVTERYMTNPMLDIVADKPWEHRITAQAIHFGDNVGMGKDMRAFGMYFFELQNQMPARNIQSLDVSQMPRVPELDKSYADDFLPRGNDFWPCFRLWQLSNTRYVLAPTNDMASKLTPENGFATKIRLNLAVKPGIANPVSLAEDCTLVEDPNGPFVLYELTNALPRVKLFSNWKTASVTTHETLDILVTPSFDPQQLLLVSGASSLPAPAQPGADPGTAAIASYRSKRVVIDAEAKTPAILLLNDRIAPQWAAKVDGKPVEILQCNYIMRGVFLDKGKHTVEFRFEPKVTTLYASLAAWAVGILLAGFLVATHRKSADGASAVPEPPNKAASKGSDAPKA